MKLYLYFKVIKMNNREYRTWTTAELPWSEAMLKEHKEFTGPFEVEVNV